MKYKSKKGFLGWAPLINVVIVIAFIVLILMFPGKLYGAVFGDDEKESSLRNFQILVESVSNLLVSPENYEYKTAGFFLKKDNTIIGFNYDEDSVYTSDGEEIPKPGECEGYACLCYYDYLITEDKEDKGSSYRLHDCESFPGNVYFIGALSSQDLYTQARGSEGEFFDFMDGARGSAKKYESYMQPMPDNLVLNTEYFLLYGFALKFTELYLEKYQTNNEIFILITVSTEKTRLREKYYSVCSDSDLSDEECKNKRADDVVVHEGIKKVCIPKKNSGCYSRTIKDCGPIILEECACGDKAYNQGFCKLGQQYLPINCVGLSDCWDYCKIGEDPYPTICYGLEATSCTDDVCGLGCKFRKGSQGGTCVSE